MKRFLILTKAMTLMHLRNGYVLFWNFAFPILLMVIYGAVMSQFMDYMTPGVIVLNALSFGLVSSSTMMLEMREKGVLRRLQATPLPAVEMIGSYLLVNIVIGVLQSTLIIIAGVLLYKVPLSATGLLLAYPMILIGLLAFMALGGIISGVSAKSGSATAIGMTIYFLLMFISDMIFPLDMLPAWLQNVVPYLPAYPVAQLVRSAMLEATLDPKWLSQLLLLAVYGIAATFVAAKLFRWEPKA
ncbi:MAG: ABC transporter permease [Anaerolineae bacterium]|nr:ABC transporter permease [Anaerolineae bacterium]MBL8105896.1 ABC transporter permease [Anaerolineales bacterium]MCC7188547.1 ABC transporter permease [Anaerolineales bacterium]